jgi:group I intron endonuclease
MKDEIKLRHIYIIQNTNNNKIYVGQTINVKNRWYSHKYELKKNNHRDSYLQNSWNKYSENAFEFYILDQDYWTEDEVTKYEESVRVWYTGLGLCYNIRGCGPHGKMTEEYKILLSKRMSGKGNHMYGKPSPNKGKKQPQELIELRTASLRGRKLSEEHKKKLSTAHTGKKLSKEHIDKQTQGKLGQKRTEETKKRMSDAHKGINKGKPSCNTGKIHTKESRKNMSEAHKGVSWSESRRKSYEDRYKTK